jgi:hypothetical protein
MGREKIRGASSTPEFDLSVADSSSPMASKREDVMVGPTLASSTKTPSALVV